MHPRRFVVNTDDQNRLRQYLLGELSDADEAQVEERLLADESYFEQLEVIENELMDQYVQNTTSDDDRAKLEKRLLRGKRQRQKLAFATALDAESEERAKAKEKIVPIGVSPRSAWFGSSQLKIAAAVVITVGLSLSLWLLLGRKSDVERGMNALNQAQGNQRLIESRISEVQYAQMRSLRGNETALADRSERDYSERLLMDAVNERGDAASYHALGRLYLAERNFSKAREQFEKALVKAPNDPQLQSDLGATLLELGRSSGDEQRLRYFAEALQHFNRALELNPSLPEALFNQALLYQNMQLLPQAKQAWRKYLEVDPNSPWASEAERNLKALETQEQNGQAKRTDLYSSYDAAYQIKDREAAWVALKQSRSRAGNYVVEKLLDKYLSLAIAGNKKDATALRDQLSFAGEIENQHVGDRYTSDLVAFYQHSRAEKYPELARARELVNLAKEKYDASEFEPSIALLTEAQKLFAANGDTCEALFADSWIGYNELRLAKDTGQPRFERLAREYSSRSYKFLLAQSLHAVSDALTQQNEFSKVLEQAGRALKKAEEIEDDSTRLRCLQQFVSINLQLGNYAEALNYGMKALDAAPEFTTEPKLIWTFYQEIAKALCWLNLYSAAIEFQREALRLANAAQWPFIIARSYTQLGIIHQRKQEFEPAIQAGLRAIEEGRKIEDEGSRLNTISHAHMRLGHIYADARDFRNALLSYDQALLMFEQLRFGMFLYEARKGKFICNFNLDDVAAAEHELNLALALFEQYRAKIHEERNRNAFFDAGQDIYDLAIDFALTKLNDKERALNYAEDSRARALLDLIHTAPRVRDKGDGVDIQLVPGVDPQPLSSLRDSIPSGVTLVEYALLKDKLVIWVLAHGKLDVEVRQIPLADLNQQILSYVKNVANDGDAAEARIAAVSLYRTLISPIEKYLGAEDELCIVPDKILSSLPFGALVSPDTGEFLIKSHRLVVAPSANVFVTCTQEGLRKQRSGVESLLSVGNPSFSRQRFAHFVDLPSAAREARQVAASYKTEALLGANATEAQVRARMPRADVIHFAAHYVIDSRSPMMSSLLLSKSSATDAPDAQDGLLHAHEIYAMKLRRTRLAVLSACQTGLERSYQGEGAIGIARSFISARVPVVVASLWPVDSDLTAPLMIKFHQYRRNHGFSSAEALRRAQLDMLASDEKHQKPYAWAAFVVYGGHATF